MNGAQFFGSVFFGFLIDRFATAILLFVCSFGSATSVFGFWGFATSPALLWLFAIVYGLFAGGYTVIFTGCNREVQRRAPHAETSLLMGTWAAGRGIGAIVSGPLSNKLLELKLGEGTLRFAYGTKFGILIVFIGVTAVVGGLGGFIARGRQPATHEGGEKTIERRDPQERVASG